MKALNKAQVDALFEREAVMINGEDVIPEFRIDDLFGVGALDLTKGVSAGKYTNGFGVGDYTLFYVTYKGFLIAASYYNTQQLRGDDPGEARGQGEVSA